SMRAFRQLLIAYSLLQLLNNGLVTWQPGVFERSFRLNSGFIGTWFAIIYGISQLLATYWGGELASKLAPNNERFQLRAMAIITVFFAGVVWGLIYVYPNSR